jgi:beta-glucosidase-like glycosyl hydrolase/CubicO group peptidase (beta-lactamase class C family)
MTVEQKVGQIMVPGHVPRFYHTDDVQFKRLIKLVKDYHVGGVMIYRGMPYEVARSIDRLQQKAGLPLLVMADVEWGLSMRVNQGTRFLENMAIGATGDEGYAYEMGRITAMESKAIGVHIGFAPVMDVNNNPDNIIINTRSYGEDPELVSRLGAAFIRGLQESGVYATAKHYPGHGDTDVDSHLNLPAIEASKERVQRIGLPPFKAAVDAGVKCIMVGHLTYGAFAQMQGRPATLDPYFIKQVLRKEMSFEGLVITDAMEMGGITENYWSGQAAIMAINAGVDMLLLPPDFETTFSFVVQAVRDGRIPVQRIDEAVRRILRAKAELGLANRPVFDITELERVLSSPEHLGEAEEIANASVTLLRDDQEIIPFRAEQLDSVLVVTITDEEASRASNPPLSREVKRRVPVARSAYVDPRSTEEEIRGIIAMADSVEAIVTGVFVRWSDHKGSISLSDTTVALLKEFLQTDKPMAVISFGSPYILRQIPNVPSYLCAYGTVPLAVRAAVRAIFGEIPIEARIPVSIPGHYNVGDGLRREARSMELVEAIGDDFLQDAYTVLQRAISDSVFPGAQVAVVNDGTLIASRGFGRQTYDEDSPKVDTQTIYDLASVTKVAATTVCAMRLWEQSKLLLDIPVSAYLPKFKGADKDSITLRHLLTHSSGVHWWADLWTQASNPEEALDYIYQLPLDYAPGDSMIYSDLGLILVGKILETVTGETIAELSQNLVFEPMGMQNTGFNPEKILLNRIAPTEIGGNLNRGLIHGDVHDENAHFFNGVSTHAGLFSNAEDLAALAQMLLNGGIYRHHRFLSPQTVEYWTARQRMPESSIRALGWVTPADEGSSSGDYFASGSFGHTGFTGTSIWIDPHRQIAIILLTNRVHPTRERGGMHQVRRDFHNAAMAALLQQMGEEVPGREPEVSNP